MPHADLETRREYHREYGRDWDERNPEARAIIQQRYDRKRYGTEERQKQHAEARRRRHIRQRVLVIEIYGGRCAFCGCDQYEYLTVDHVGGTGAGKAHRAEFSPKYRNIYDYLARTEFRPDLYRLLCANCHTGLTQYGVEPGGEDLHDLDYWREAGALRRAANGSIA